MSAAGGSSHWIIARLGDRSGSIVRLEQLNLEAEKWPLNFSFPVADAGQLAHPARICRWQDGIVAAPSATKLPTLRKLESLSRSQGFPEASIRECPLSPLRRNADHSPIKVSAAHNMCARRSLSNCSHPRVLERRQRMPAVVHRRN